MTRMREWQCSGRALQSCTAQAVAAPADQEPSNL